MGKIKSKVTEWTPNSRVSKLLPKVSGNSVNGLDEADWRAPQPVFWRVDDSIEHGDILQYFYKLKVGEKISKSRKLREERINIPLSDIADVQVEKTSEKWKELIVSQSREIGAEEVGVCLYRPEWTFSDRPQPRGRWAIVLAFAHDYKNLSKAPHEDTYSEVIDQYGRAAMTAKLLANWIREQGWYADPKMGPNTEDVLMIPAAIESGIGQLGKHGSLISKKLGSNFRLSMVLTDLPLVSDNSEEFGSEEFCTNCQICTNACPPNAISSDKKMVRGDEKWYVDFDKCLPYFVESHTCGICLAVCPWSRPGIADNLLKKFARKSNSA